MDTLNSLKAYKTRSAIPLVLKNIVTKQELVERISSKLNYNCDELDDLMKCSKPTLVKILEKLS